MSDFDPPHSNSESEQPTSWSHQQFVDRIKIAVRTHDIPTSELPKRIDLSGGAIGNICDRMIAETIADPRKRERGSYAKVTVDGRMLVSNEITVGEETRVGLSPKMFMQVDIANPHYSKSEYHALDMHTHGIVDVPPSSQDFLSVLTDAEDYGGQAIIVVTPTTRFLVMRTNETPSRNAEAAREVVDTKAQEFHKAASEEMSRFKSHMGQFGGASREQLVTHNNKINAQLIMKNVLDICKENNLVLFTSTGNNVFVRAD